MPKSTKRIKCYYYQLAVVSDAPGHQDRIFEFDKWMRKRPPKDEMKQHVQLNDCIAYIDDLHITGEGRYYFVRFYRLRTENLPARIKDGEKAEPIQLDEGEYIGNDLNMLYDRETGFAMVQRNYLSLTTSRLSEWMSRDLDSDEKVAFRPIFQKLRLQRMKKDEVRSIELSFANLDTADYNGPSSLSHLLNGFGRYKGYTAKIKISVGRGKGQSLDTRSIEDLLADTYCNQDIVEGGKVKLREEGKPNIESVDIFNDAISDELQIEVVKSSGSADFYAMETKMLAAYKERVDELKKCTGLGN